MRRLVNSKKDLFLFSFSPETSLFLLLCIARRGAVQLDLDLLVQVVVVLLENGDDLGLGEFLGHGLPLAHELAEHGAREEQPGAALVVPVLVDLGLRLVGAGLHGSSRRSSRGEGA